MINVGAALSPITSLLGSFAVFPVTNQLLDMLPVGSAYFRDTVIKGLTYGELMASTVIVFSLACCLGLAHGVAWGRRYATSVCLAAMGPATLVWIFFVVMSMGMAFFAFPVVLAYGAAVWWGQRWGASLRSQPSGDPA